MVSTPNGKTITPSPTRRVYKVKVRARKNEIVWDQRIIDPDWKGL
jgi:hypothetical protein